MDLSLRQIRAFVSVAHLKSFTRAAALLHLSQPALTVQIRRLEEALGVKLLDRNSRTVELTRVGRELAPVLQRLLRELDSVVIDTRDLAAKRHGVVRIAALPSVAAGLLPDVIAAFREGNPRVTFVLSTTSKKVQSAPPKPRSRTALRYRKEEAPDCSGASLARYSGENGRA